MEPLVLLAWSDVAGRRSRPGRRGAEGDLHSLFPVSGNQGAVAVQGYVDDADLTQEKNIMANQKPVEEVRIGRVKATVWRNGTDEQPRYNVTFSRLYKESDQWKSTQSFGRNDLLVLAKVADLVHTRILQLPAEAELPEVQVDES